jgi:outer membrane lipoprotein carrier protein
MQFKRLAVGMSSGAPARIELTDAFDQTTRIDLQGVSNRATVAAQTFKFTPPPGVDVIQQ